MRKALIPMFASLALCGAAAGVIAISTAHAQPAQHTPMMVAQADNPAPPRRGFNRPAPADLGQRLTRLCQDSVARQTGDLAYLETSLNLTAAQQTSFQRWKDAKLAIAHRHADLCAQQVNERLAQRQANQSQPNQANQAGPNQASPNPVRADRVSPAERMAREEDRLKQRLADIAAERPALEAFYNVLSPDQKTTFERASMRDRGNLMRNRFAFSAGPRGPMGGRMPGAPPEAR
jgi:hypothetical protein